MNLNMNIELGKDCVKKTAKARIITEDWLLNNFTCPFCNNSLQQYKNNNPSADFYCKKCNEDFELKSTKGKFGKKFTGSEYKHTLQKINDNNSSNWILLEHKDFVVTRLTLIPKQFFYDKVVEPRNKLSDEARRAGWQGCRINTSLIPSFGKIDYIKNSKVIDKKIINYKLERASRFKNSNVKEKNWKLEILYLIDKLPEPIFTLNDLNEHIPELNESKIGNKNNTIDSTIRRKLQELRDDGLIKFIDRGLYQKLF